MAPVARDDRRQRKAVLGKMNRRREVAREGQLAELLVELGPAVHDAGHAPRVGRVERDRAVLLGRDLLRLEPERRAAAGVESVELLRLRIPHDREHVAADAVGRGLHETRSEENTSELQSHWYISYGVFFL